MTSTPIKELNNDAKEIMTLSNLNAGDYQIADKGKIHTPYELILSADTIKDCSITLSNEEAEKIIIGDRKTNEYYIDRTQSGLSNFTKVFF